MSPQRRRISARERARREKIAAGVRRYWRQVHAVQRKESAPLDHARARVAAIRKLRDDTPRLSFERARAQSVAVPPAQPSVPAAPPPIYEAPRGRASEFAFEMRDGLADNGRAAASAGRGRTVTATLQYHVFTEGRDEEPRIIERAVPFYGGDSDEEFWANFHRAVREDYDALDDGYGLYDENDEPSYEDFAILVSRLA